MRPMTTFLFIILGLLTVSSADFYYGINPPLDTRGIVSTDALLSHWSNSPNCIKSSCNCSASIDSNLFGVCPPFFRCDPITSKCIFPQNNFESMKTVSDFYQHPEQWDLLMNQVNHHSDSSQGDNCLSTMNLAQSLLRSSGNEQTMTNKGIWTVQLWIACAGFNNSWNMVQHYVSNNVSMLPIAGQLVLKWYTENQPKEVVKHLDWMSYELLVNSQLPFISYSNDPQSNTTIGFSTKTWGSDGNMRLDLNTTSNENCSGEISHSTLSTISQKLGNAELNVAFSSFNANPLGNSTSAGFKLLDEGIIIGLSVITRSGNNVEVSNTQEKIVISIPVVSMEDRKAISSLKCAWWNEKIESWSFEGCDTIANSSTNIECHCNHLTNFTLVKQTGASESLHSVKNEPLGTSTDSKLLIIIVSTGVAVFILIAAVFVNIFLIRRRRRNNSIIKSLSMENQRATFEEMTFIKDETIVRKAKNGMTHYGEIFDGLLSNVTPVILKKLDTHKLRGMFIEEYEIVKTLRHPNIIQFLGIWKDTASDIHMVFESMNEGDLATFLLKNEVSYEKKLEIAHTVAGAVRYLHINGLVHGDISAKCVKINSNLAVKLSEFGQSRKVDSGLPKKTPPFVSSVRWTAPEVIKQQMYSTKSDVWSFGVFLWELMSDGMIPYSGLTGKSRIEEAICKGNGLPKPPHCPDEYFSIISSCLCLDPSCRPSIVEVDNMIRRIQNPNHEDLKEENYNTKVYNNNSTRDLLLTDLVLRKSQKDSGVIPRREPTLQTIDLPETRERIEEECIEIHRDMFYEGEKNDINVSDYIEDL
eukprot:TRINITY_DN794_c0_g1_i1.p1 TRINITY_DN794_c0_g1~~TRINITY_DN794_c0_g1_i1.p1  ORF type:complete len:811 (+),score=207.65 TRINITY_DN794_c0_g1_i1:94-2526(+)